MNYISAEYNITNPFINFLILSQLWLILLKKSIAATEATTMP